MRYNTALARFGDNPDIDKNLDESTTVCSLRSLALNYTSGFSPGIFVWIGVLSALGGGGGGGGWWWCISCIWIC